jgi:hypothetical protein
VIPRSLPVVDDPHPDESLFGFVLRMCQRNRLAGMTWLLGQLGRRSITQLGESDERAIAHLFGADPVAVERLVVRGRWVDGAHHHWAYGHHLTRPYLLRLTRPQWCPKCLTDGGYARAAWEFQLSTACHVHGVTLAEQCPRCGRRQRWQRTSLYSCGCGASLSDAPTDSAPDEALEVSAWIARQLEEHRGGQSVQAAPCPAGPWSVLGAGLSLDGGMRLLYAAGLRRDAGHRVGPGEARAGLTTLECRDACVRGVARMERIHRGPSEEERRHLRELLHLPALAAIATDGLVEADRQLVRSLLEVGLGVPRAKGRFAGARDNAQLQLPGV